MMPFTLWCYLNHYLYKNGKYLYRRVLISVNIYLYITSLSILFTCFENIWQKLVVLIVSLTKSINILCTIDNFFKGYLRVQIKIFLHLVLHLAIIIYVCIHWSHSKYDFHHEILRLNFRLWWIMQIKILAKLNVIANTGPSWSITSNRFRYSSAIQLIQWKT